MKASVFVLALVLSALVVSIDCRFCFNDTDCGDKDCCYKDMSGVCTDGTQGICTDVLPKGAYCQGKFYKSRCACAPPYECTVTDEGVHGFYTMNCESPDYTPLPLMEN